MRLDRVNLASSMKDKIKTQLLSGIGGAEHTAQAVEDSIQDFLDAGLLSTAEGEQLKALISEGVEPISDEDFQALQTAMKQALDEFGPEEVSS